MVCPSNNLFKFGSFWLTRFQVMNSPSPIGHYSSKNDLAKTFPYQAQQDGVWAQAHGVV